MFLTLGFVFKSDLNNININSNTNDQFKDNQIKYNKSNEFKNHEFLIDQNESLMYNPFKSIDEVYFFTKKILNLCISNVKILEDYNSFKIACAVISFTREILLKKNTNKVQDKNELSFNNKNSQDNIYMIGYPDNTVEKKDDFLSEEVIRDFRWNNNLKNYFRVDFEDFKVQYEIIKK